MYLSTAISLLGLVAAILFPLLARRDLLTKLAAQDQSREEWRGDVTKRLAALEDRKQTTDFAALQAMDKAREKAWWEWRRTVDYAIKGAATIPYRVGQLERLQNEYREWKHVKADPYIIAHDGIEKRVTRIESRLNGMLK